MALSVRFKILNSLHPQPEQGITLIEMAMAMMIVAVLGVGVSGMLKVGAEHNLSERQHQTMQVVAMNLVDDLRYDLRAANTINALGGGSNTLVIHTTDKQTNAAQTITYALNGSAQMTRQLNNLTPKIYNDPSVFLSNMQIQCSPNCFQVATGATFSTNGTPTQIAIPQLTVSVPLVAGNKGTVIDQAFQAPNFKLSQFSFNVTAATEFQ